MAFLQKVLALTQKYAPFSHSHDDRYYTESEVNALLANQATSVSAVEAIGPDYSKCINLPAHVFTTNTWWTPYVYKINVPGYIYWSVKRMACDMDIGLVLSNTFTNLNLLPSNRDTYAPKCMLWHSFSRQDDYSDNSYLFPLLIPGTSTYMRFFVGSTSDGGTSAADPKMFFIPCKAVSNKVASSNCVTWTATTNGIDNDRYGSSWILGNHPSAVGSTIFAGDWKTLHSVKW